MLKGYEWKYVYRTGTDNLLTDFYIPALARAKFYNRAVGFFSSHILSAAAQGLSSLIKNNGKMRLIIGHPLDAVEYEAVKNGKQLEELDFSPASALNEALQYPAGDLETYRLQLLCWMIACRNLEIKFAFRKKGMYHEKIGVLIDGNNDKLVFQGSANESLNAMQDLNAESISTYPSWESVYQTHGLEYERAFDQVWNSKQLGTYCVQLPSKDYNRIAELAAVIGKPNLDIELDFLSQRRDLGLFVSNLMTSPFIPNSLLGNPFQIRDHQRKALESWRANDYKGILKLATGAGKTITAIYGTVKVLDVSERLFVVVAVPYIELANQWVQVFRSFRINAHKCFIKKSNWYEKLQADVLAFKTRSIDFCCLVVVNATLSSSSFQILLRDLPRNKILFIGDECHHHGAENISNSLPDTHMRMGLSATPYRSDEEEIESPFPDYAKERITNYYGNVVCEYTLSDAISDGVLTPYNYHIHLAYLTSCEQEEFKDLSNEITALVKSGRNNDADRKVLVYLCGKRSRLLGAAEEKFDLLKDIVARVDSANRYHSLFYCAEGYHDNDESESPIRQVSRVSKILADEGWRTTQFTCLESSEKRKQILDSFLHGDIQGLVSMKVLDEGIDIPACSQAYILASTRNPRQYIQRRGRILRKFPGKKYAEIHDFVVLPNPSARNDPSSERLKTAELERVYDFLELARNKAENLQKIDEIGNF